MKFKKTILISASVTTLVTPLATVFACGSSGDSYFYSNLKSYSSKIQYKDFIEKDKTFDITQITSPVTYDATIVKWIDGDTPVVTTTTPIKGQTEWHVRVNAIDTPELHTGANSIETTGEEFKWAKKAKEFGDQEMPAGTKVKLLTDGGTSFDRITGSFFYKKPQDSEYKSYSVEILRNGLTMPLFNDSVLDVLTKGNLMNITGIAMADAYNDAIKNHRGLFGVDAGKILKLHGLTNDSNIRYRIGKRDTLLDAKNIYELANKTR